MTDRELIAAALEATGLSARRLAVLCAANERSMRRWQEGDPLDPKVRAILRLVIAAPRLVMDTLGVHPLPPGWLVSAANRRRVETGD